MKEVDMPPVPAEFSIGYGLEPDGFLQSDRFPNAFVFDGAKIGRTSVALACFRACPQELCRPQKTADVIGMKKQFFP
jgi:hypothetical protein